MFTKQVSRPVDNLDAHRGPRGRADHADSKKDLVTAQSEVFVPYTLVRGGPEQTDSNGGEPGVPVGHPPARGSRMAPLHD
jgi:hypothetical protein